MRKYLIDNPDKEGKGVFAISLVEQPAMESEWVALKENTIELKAINDKEQILLGVALIPDKPVYRNDNENGEYLIEFSSDAIKETAHKFLKTGMQNNATVNHDVKLGKEVVSVVESWIIEDDAKDKTRLHNITEPVGSWAVKLKVNDPDLYNQAANGNLKGISIEGLFDKTLVNLKEDDMSKQSIADAVKEGFAEAMKLFKEEPKQSDKSTQVKLGEVTLVDGQTVVSFEGEQPEAGKEATVNGDPVPVGEHKTESGQVIVVEEAGTIADVRQSETNDDETEAEREQIKKAIQEAVSNLSAQQKTELEKVKGDNKKIADVLEELSKKVDKLSETPNKSVKDKPQSVKTEDVELTRKGRILQELRN